ncbi:MAG: prepilin-type N-terminal cleavage/methylation domain-containing protein [Verrucomicrobiota bacterium]
MSEPVTGRPTIKPRFFGSAAFFFLSQADDWGGWRFSHHADIEIDESKKLNKKAFNNLFDMALISNKRGFTLVELLTVIAVIGVLAGILIPVIGRVREAARRSSCASNLRQLATASQLYSAENRGALIAEPFTENDENNSPRYWFRQLYPYLKADSVTRVTALFQCPNDEAAVEAFSDGGTEWNSISYLLLKQETSHKKRLHIAAPSRSPQFVDAERADTANYRSDAKFETIVKGALSDWRHNQGVNVAFWDGHVSFVEDPTYQTLFNLNTN